MKVNRDNFAVVFVHPFWLMLNFPASGRTLFDKERRNRKYGSYKVYSHNLRKAYDVVESKGVRSVFMLPFKKVNGALRPWSAKKRLIPLEDSIIFSWEPYHDFATHSTGWTYSRIIYNGEYQVKEFLSGIDEIRDSLTGTGIRSVALCGEMGPYDKSLEGCVGVVAKNFRQKIEVYGLEGCVFPVKPYEPHVLRLLKTPECREIASRPILRSGFESNRREIREVTEILYERTMKLDELERLRR